MSDAPPTIQPPKPPWVRGIHEDYSCLTVTVEVCRDAEGRVFSIHRLENEDQQVAMTWPSYGQEQVAFALLVEAVRREATLGMLVQMSKDPGYPQRLRQLPAKEQDEAIAEMTVRLRTHLDMMVARLAKASVMEAAETLSR